MNVAFVMFNAKLPHKIGTNLVKIMMAFVYSSLNMSSAKKDWF